MYDFLDELSTILCPILVSYITASFSIKRQISDISISTNQSDENLKQSLENELKCIKKYLFYIFIFQLTIHFLPDILNIISFKNVNPSEFPRLNLSFFKILFSDMRFSITYTLGVIWTYLICAFILNIYDETLENFSYIALRVALVFSTIWINYFISLFLLYCLPKNLLLFSLLALVINCIANFVIDIFLCVFFVALIRTIKRRLHK